MTSGKTFNIKILNILIAFLISLFVIFPDIVFLNTRPFQPERDPMAQDDRSEENSGQSGMWSPPPGERSFRPLPASQSRLLQAIPRSPADRIVVNYLFFFVLSIVLLSLNTYNLFYRKKKLNQTSALTVSICENLFVCLFFAVLYTFIDHRGAVFPLDGMNLFKVLFVGLVSFLFTYVMFLMNRQQKMVLENEQLKSENLLAQYNMLVGQINPHFFFNSLNSLSSLVRENENERSLKYINELSDIFRYILKANKQGLTTLKEELDFLRAYRYMMEIRYEGKLHFHIKVDKKYLHFQIPTFSTQLLTENIIKHNEISEDNPLTVDIHTTNDNMLVVSNLIRKKIATGNDSGIGLQNLNNRYRLLVDKNISIENDDIIFTVKLPLTITPGES